ncbi:DNA mismatch repair protein MutS [Candidatus Marinamargulisbacteria bacterium SCGC AG-414-C22]|nr:DNA mismatch repair protein MutS [Candidatus Marinamargulisbacteria bacterium SCGC AG-414-C22]
MSNLQTPMMKQYCSIKEEHQDCILFFRLGDFYEMFFDDAITAAKELDLTLTGRGKDENRIPMCGAPHHACEQYIAKLIRKGYKVAICDQVEDANESKGITKREVTRIVSPGTAISDAVIEADTNNYLVALFQCSDGSFGLSYADNSTGEFKCAHLADWTNVTLFLDRLAPKECLIQEGLSLSDYPDILRNTTSFLTPVRAKEELLSHFQLNHLQSFGLQDHEHIIPAAWAIIDYLKKMHHSDLPHITQCHVHFDNQCLLIDKLSVRNLELITPLSQDQKQGSLFWVLNKTKTALGARLLKQWIRSPLYDVSLIEHRLDAVESLKNDLLSREEIRDQLSLVYDLERLLTRISSDYHNPRDILALKESLTAALELTPILVHLTGHNLDHITAFFQEISAENHPFQQLISTIEQALVEPAPTTISQVGFIKPGYNSELDDLTLSFKTIKDWIATLEEKEREATGIKTLKVGFNKVFGYFFQVSKGQTDHVPDHYIRKQTLTNAERYISPELKEKETILLHGEEKQLVLEQALFKELLITIRDHISILQRTARYIAELDCYQSLAMVSQQNNYCRPSFTATTHAELELVDARHPVLEKQGQQHVIANSLTLNNDRFFQLITGPNMAGKSTFMKQVAVIVIMAQCGCFVPATSARLRCVDKLFTRIGASDNLVEGQSTFMVEMTETAHILHNATAHSLILLDEIGRGTSTYDGMAIAGAVMTYIHDNIKAMTLFATHYHELTQLADQLQHVFNASMAIHEENGKLAFTYQIVEGPADKSYGVHVAEMAGLPTPVINQATQMLASFEATAQQPQVDGQLVLF